MPDAQYTIVCLLPFHTYIMIHNVKGFLCCVDWGGLCNIRSKLIYPFTIFFLSLKIIILLCFLMRLSLSLLK